MRYYMSIISIVSLTVSRLSFPFICAWPQGQLYVLYQTYYSYYRYLLKLYYLYYLYYFTILLNIVSYIMTIVMYIILFDDLFNSIQHPASRAIASVLPAVTECTWKQVAQVVQNYSCVSESRDTDWHNRKFFKDILNGDDIKDLILCGQARI